MLHFIYKGNSGGIHTSKEEKKAGHRSLSPGSTEAQHRSLSIEA
jgi:hypothetical protein